MLHINNVIFMYILIYGLIVWITGNGSELLGNPIMMPVSHITLIDIEENLYFILTVRLIVAVMEVAQKTIAWSGVFIPRLELRHWLTRWSRLLNSRLWLPHRTNVGGCHLSILCMYVTTKCISMLSSTYSTYKLC